MLLSRCHVCTRESLYLWDHVFKRIHNGGALSFLVVGEDAGDEDDGRKNNTEVELCMDCKKQEHVTCC